MAKFLTFSAFGYRDARGRFARRTASLAQLRRELGREAGRTMTTELQSRAPRKTGKFAAGLFYRTYERGNALEVRFYSGGEHAYVLPFLLHGTVDHDIPSGGSAIQLAKGYPLRFYWENGPQGPGIYRYWSVHHPGTQPHPFVDRARDAAEPVLRELLRRQVVRLAFL